MTKYFKDKKLEDVVSVYNGKPGCMCSCLGTYLYSEKYKEYAGKNRGYEIKENEINDRKVKLMFNKFMKNLDLVKCNDGTEEDKNSYIYMFDTDTRTNVIYFKEN